MMHKNYISVQFTAPQATAEIIIALLMDKGFEGSQETGQLVEASIPEIHFDAGEVAAVFNRFAVEYTTKRVAQENWNASWEKSFSPVFVQDYAAIRAAFHEPVFGVKHEIVITPQMSFGTGHHASTYLMISLMQELNFANKYVVDFGTGTGVLAIIAEKEGAAKVLAIDNDEWSIMNTAENIAANQCNKIEVQKLDEMSETKGAEIILANINLNVIVANLERIKKASAPGADILFSGILETDVAVLSEKLSLLTFAIHKVRARENWAAIHAQMI